MLHIAAARNLHDRISFLIDKGAVLHKKSENGFTPAELVLEYELKEAAEILLCAKRDRS